MASRHFLGNFWGSGIVLFCACILSGCSVRSFSPSAEDQPEGAADSSTAEIAEVGKQEPVEVEVVQAFVHDEKLNVKVYVSAKTPIPARDVAVTLRGLSDGAVVGEATQLVSNVTAEKTLNPGKATALQLTIPGQGLSEYQVQCSWGSEAHAVAKLSGIPIAEESTAAPRSVAAAQSLEAPVSTAGSSRVETARMSDKVSEALSKDVTASGSTLGKIPADLQLHVLALDSSPASCPKEPCDLNYVFRARLQNETPIPVSGIRLALGVAWVNDGDQPPRIGGPGEELRPDEQLIDLKQLVLAPGESKNVRVSLDRPLPVVPGGSFVPQLRLLEYSQPSG